MDFKDKFTLIEIMCRAYVGGHTLYNSASEEVRRQHPDVYDDIDILASHICNALNRKDI